MKKDETFRVMALGEALRLPILLIGPPGVAKTAAVIDFAKARLGGKINDGDLFLLETDEGTKSNAIKGNVDLEALTTTNKYQINSPVTKAGVVIINEIDKASAGLRNSLLGIMNEKVLFNGTAQIDCVWDNFIATCNEIPDDEKDSPFWDRFLITHEVGRLSPSDMLKYYSKGGKDHSQNHEIEIPDESDILAISLSPDKLKKTIDLIYSKLSDRALSFLPILVKNVMCVWGLSEDKAFIKSAELLVNKSVGKELAKTLVIKEIRELYDVIDGIGECVSNEGYNEQYDKLEKAFAVAQATGKLTPGDHEDLKKKIAKEEKKLNFLQSDDPEIINQF